MKQTLTKAKVIANEIHKLGGTCYIVGGFVRDMQFGAESKDIDIEVHGLQAGELEATLKHFGEVDLVGKSFGVYLLKGLDIDWSLPRTENSVGAGHKDFEVSINPYMGIKEALRRRDFTMNAMAINMKKDRLEDPYGGICSCNTKVLSLVDKDTFVEDPLRVFRAAQFLARFDMEADEELSSVCMTMMDSYIDLPKERIWEELKKLLLKGKVPSKGLKFLEWTLWLKHWPELDDLFKTPQDPRHHPEGHVGIHTCEVIDNAAQIREIISEEKKLTFMLACLLHDVGKPSTTIHHEGDRITSHGHELAGGKVSRRFLERLTNEESMIVEIMSLVTNHMFPHCCTNAKEPAFRRLSKRVDAYLLGKVCEADGMTEENTKHYYKMLKNIGRVELGNKSSVVMGRDLIKRGFTPGPEFGDIIRACEEIFLETGERDPAILISKTTNNL